jgi:hypothetical protein
MSLVKIMVWIFGSQYSLVLIALEIFPGPEFREALHTSSRIREVVIASAKSLMDR